MLTYATRIEYQNKDKGEAVVNVQSKLTFYRVVVAPSGITLLGPGLDQPVDEEMQEKLIAIYEQPEALALACVLYFESTN